jgi:Diacylglycerol acyltransferase
MLSWLAAACLFWPASAVIFGIIFLLIVLIFLFIAGGIVLFLLLVYGIYAALRDSGLLDVIIRFLNEVIDSVILLLRGNVSKSFQIDVGDTDLSGLGTEPRIYACGPHGMYGISWAIHLCTKLTDWGSVPKPKLAVHSIFFRIPFVREFMLSRNCMPATEEAICSEIRAGNSVALLIGGIEELYKTELGKINLVIDKRKGYIRLAKKMGVPIQPLLTVGENELFPFIENDTWSRVQKVLYDWFHIAAPIPKWSAINKWMSIMYKPLDEPCITYFLEPVQTENKSEEEIRNAHKDCLKDFSKESGHIITFIS